MAVSRLFQGRFLLRAAAFCERTSRMKAASRRRIYETGWNPGDGNDVLELASDANKTVLESHCVWMVWFQNNARCRTDFDQLACIHNSHFYALFGDDTDIMRDDN